ncbi:hypothetical protein RIF29_29985 [Crotalaria pallida]|uniref:S1 motif domain-containing protein n=1 Tax=Crotalaria pallida TaxID=3830 RepID=A0AAN9EFH6_CROPI
MIATLCGVKNEIVSWKFYPLEKFLTSDEKLEIIEWVMTNITNQVGIDINLAIRHDWLLAPLQFVSCDDPIFVDTVGNILDRTRIHPESYYLAEELARVVHESILENPDANVNQENAEGQHYIKMELLHPFEDPRRPYNEPSQDEEYYMITGEIGNVLVEGRRVQASFRHVQRQQAFCMLDSGMTGVLCKEDFADDAENIFLTDKLREGDVLTCKIMLIDKSRCRVNLTCKASEMKNDDNQSFHEMDPYYCQESVTLPNQVEMVHKKELENKHFMPRMVCHPHFQNLTAHQAKEFLADKDVGEYIFHPISRGPCYLTLSLKIFGGLYVHKDIVEGGKNHDMKSLLGLGKTLKIGEEIFEGIDKVIGDYVNPLLVNLKAMINFRKFKKGSKAEVDDELLKLEKGEYPKRISYGFGISHEHPGTFILSYIRSTNPLHEFIGMHPKGFKFRKQIFENLEQLVTYFQNHINDAPLKFRESTFGGKNRRTFHLIYLFDLAF